MPTSESVLLGVFILSHVALAGGNFLFRFNMQQAVTISTLGGVVTSNIQLQKVERLQ